MTPSDHYAARLAELRRNLINHSLDAFIILHAPNIRYLTGFSGSTAVLTVTSNDAALSVDGRYTEQANVETHGAVAREVARPIVPSALAQLTKPGGRIGFEANHLTVAEHDLFREKLPQATLVGLNGVVERQRAVKDEEELASLRTAIQIADQVFDDFCGWIKPGLVEAEVAARLEYEQRMLGGEKNASGVTIVASGTRSSLPHGVATRKVIGEREPVTIDIGTVVDGYCSDLTRTIYLGKAGDEFRRIYQIVYDAQQATLDNIRAGMSANEADALARDVITQAGFGEYFGHSLGHSVGYDVHERPFLNPRDKTVLAENMVLTIEPGIYLPGRFGVRIEDIVRITAGGCELLSRAPRRLVEVQDT